MLLVQISRVTGGGWEGPAQPFAQAFTSSERNEAGVCIPTSMANVLSPMWSLPFLYSASL